jgi:hypothetical protein
VVATKAGLTRQGPNQWAPVGRPEYLRQCVEMSLRRLKVDTIDLYQLHRIDPKVPAEDQFGAFKDFQTEGKIRYIGLSEVSVAEIEAARKIIDVVTVQNLYNITNRQSEAVLEYSEKNNIGFIPWFPVASGELARPGGPLDEAAKKHDATVAQLALAWRRTRPPLTLSSATRSSRRSPISSSKIAPGTQKKTAASTFRISRPHPIYGRTVTYQYADSRRSVPRELFLMFSGFALRWLLRRSRLLDIPLLDRLDRRRKVRIVLNLLKPLRLGDLWRRL